ncbi:MAG: helix-hairpin-helix domain-containing protein, partial [Myxococcota bacterium]
EIVFEGPSPAEEDAEREGVIWRGRRARVTAHGAHAQGLLDDWMERVEGDLSGAAGDTASAGGKQPTGSSANARKLLLLGLGLAVWGTLSLAGEPEGPGCESLVELESDILGTLHARCWEAVDGAARPTSGMGRLLAGERLDLNTASPSLLAVLPQLGEVRAEAIVRTREDRDDQRFSSLEELVSVPGIGPKIRRRIEPWLTAAASKWP